MIPFEQLPQYIQDMHTDAYRASLRGQNSLADRITRGIDKEIQEWQQREAQERAEAQRAADEERTLRRITGTGTPDPAFQALAEKINNRHLDIGTAQRNLMIAERMFQDTRDGTDTARKRTRYLQELRSAAGVSDA
ncbi:hypothetical protein [Amycolatopsis sp. GM8]|uniref:hypothetical protein n=1 Tax=Amycolatopsis sp. GM8 TaxID=2896530 RepID=UPI001F32CD9B|nr:hypothetical protein [Amycolatopsis sp. GM8]